MSDYLALISAKPLLWGLFLLYMVLTTGLAYLGHKKTTDIKSFAVGAGDMNPVIVGITLAASIASTATFVLNPGLVYEHGVSALMHLGVSAGLGIVVGLVSMSFGFRRVGQAGGAVTLPQWMGQRYDSPRMAMFFTLTNMLSLMFVILIVGALALVMMSAMGLSYTESTLLIIAFVFSYIFLGGTYAHAYTNTLQGIIMVFIAGIIVWSGADLIAQGDVLGRLAAIDPNLAKTVNPKSSLYGSLFSVYACGFIIGFAVISQPHILIKALYVKRDRDVAIYLAVCLGVSVLFTALMLVGIYAHLKGMPPSDFIDAKTGLFRQGNVMPVYIKATFDQGMQAVITVALMAAGMSTLDGLLIALSSIAANDLFLGALRPVTDAPTPEDQPAWWRAIARTPLTAPLRPLLGDPATLHERTEDELAHAGHRAGQVILVLMGVATFIIVQRPPKSLAIFGQLGVYGIVAAAIAPLLLGILFPRLKGKPAFAAAILALVTHFGLYALGAYATAQKINLQETAKSLGPLNLILDTSMIQLGLLNPAVTAVYGIILSFLVALPFCFVGGKDEAVVAD